jgi:general secretion pathway protein K
MRKSDRGIALLATILAIALMTLLVVDFTTSAALGYRSAANQADQLRAYYLARSGIQVGLAVLARDSISEGLERNPHDGFDQAWAQPIPPIAVGGGTVTIAIVDEARKLDLNLLFNPRTRVLDEQYSGMLVRLLANIGVSADLIPVMTDWLDPDSVESPGGAESDYYLRLTPPYEPRNGPMPTIGDLHMLKGMDDGTFMLLSRYLTTMPEPRVSANTAPPEVLAALIPEFQNNLELVKEIVGAREVRPFLAVTDVANLPGVGQFAAHLTPLLTTRSTYFRITGEGSYAGSRRRIYATFRRNTNGTAVLMNWHED